MSNTPNMNIVLPTPGADTGVWGTEVNTGLGVVDTHDHTPGKGVPVPSTAVSFVSDIDLNTKALSGATKLQMADQGAALTGLTNKLALNAASGDLYYTNSSGVPVQITQGSSITSPTSSAALPTGGVMPFAGTAAPTGWLLADGSAVDRTVYAALFGVIGTIYGTGDGLTTFNVPNMSGRVAVGVGTYTDSVSGSVTRSLAQVAGAEKHILSPSEGPSHTHVQSPHTHNLTDPGHKHTVNYNSGGPSSPAITSNNAVWTGANPLQTNDGSLPAGVPKDAGLNSATTGITISSATAVNLDAGADVPHNNMQPYLGLNYIIKT
jgi:microcystin-dependent protein